MSAFGFAPQVLRASAKFQKDPEKPEKEDRKRKLQSQEPLLAHALINNILQPARETIGKILKQNLSNLFFNKLAVHSISRNCFYADC